MQSHRSFPRSLPPLVFKPDSFEDATPRQPTAEVLPDVCMDDGLVPKTSLEAPVLATVSAAAANTGTMSYHPPLPPGNSPGRSNEAIVPSGFPPETLAAFACEVSSLARDHSCAKPPPLVRSDAVAADIFPVCRTPDMATAMRVSAPAPPFTPLARRVAAPSSTTYSAAPRKSNAKSCSSFSSSSALVVRRGVVVHVEVCQQPHSDMSFSALRERILSYLRQHDRVCTNITLHRLDFVTDQVLQNNVEFISISDNKTSAAEPGIVVSLADVQVDPGIPGVAPLSSVDNTVLMLHLYQMSDADTSGAIDMDQAPGSNHEHPPSFHADTTGFDGDQAAMNGAQPTSGEETAQEDASCMEYAIPNREFHGIWESLVFDQNGQVQSRLLQYATTAMLFSEYNVNSNVVSWNRVILLHGPPGSGKTSLCKALAQKLAIRLSGRHFAQGRFIEINSHNLFSKYFSESGKLVGRLFARIRQVVRDERTLVCLLIDEVESITAARQSASTGADPSDALRVVNAVLTQIDSLRHNRNVLLMATSNLTKCIDAAFLDRADIKMHVGYPSWRAVYTILFTAIQELMLRGIIAPVEPVLELLALDNVDNPSAPGVLSSVRLRDAAKAAQGISGRTLKKLPLLAHAFYSNGTVTMTLQAFITALHNVAEDQHRTAVETE